MMYWGLCPGKFASKTLVPICKYVGHLMMLPGVEDIIDIRVVTVSGFFRPFFYIISLKYNLLVAILQCLIPEQSKSTQLELDRRCTTCDHFTSDLSI